MKNKCEHIELATDDPTRAKDFYATLFGWAIDAMPADGDGGEYLMFRTDNGGGGITAKMMPQQPTAWLPYITVASVHAVIASASSLGGETVVPFTPIGDMGAIAVLRDPTGGTIGVWETGKKAAAAAKPAKAAKKPAKKATPAKAAKKPAKKAKKGKR